ncbi:hypothetical protein FQR65_LT14545 [Abscondita terminalis]|nr:hypothetical protein FQR65_LT14545 [Abscondita terminalis]
MQVDSCGFFIDKDNYMLGASPDGLIGNDSIIEVKCPANAAKFTPQDAVYKKIIKYMEVSRDDGTLHLKSNHAYYYQVQGQLHITGRSLCYFVIWTPLGILVEEIEKDNVFWENEMVHQLRNFYFKCLLPEILDPRKTREEKFAAISVDIGQSQLEQQLAISNIPGISQKKYQKCQHEVSEVLLETASECMLAVGYHSRIPAAGKKAAGKKAAGKKAAGKKAAGKKAAGKKASGKSREIKNLDIKKLSKKAVIKKDMMCKNTAVKNLRKKKTDIIKTLPLPVGLFSEDVLETSQKEYKSFRLFHARKTSRTNTNTDIAHWMLIASDPIIVSHRKGHKKKNKSFTKEVLEMLIMPYLALEQANNETDEDSD